MFYGRNDLKSSVACLKERYYAGNIDKITPGCFASQLLLYAGLIVILGLVLVRFAMACIFNWFLSAKLAGPPDSMELSRSAISPATHASSHSHLRITGVHVRMFIAPTPPCGVPFLYALCVLFLLHVAICLRMSVVFRL
ncbi:hypothetical protein DFH11DRAFT_1565175 [Phellopilus nigrolimitatus]|nr:hypothetical protein DFH11DRAFT_1565175 [Phellopilus nigrolimitatus]